MVTSKAPKVTPTPISTLSPVDSEDERLEGLAEEDVAGRVFELPNPLVLVFVCKAKDDVGDVGEAVRVDDAVGVGEAVGVYWTRFRGDTFTVNGEVLQP